MYTENVKVVLFQHADNQYNYFTMMAVMLGVKRKEQVIKRNHLHEMLTTCSCLQKKSSSNITKQRSTSAILE